MMKTAKMPDTRDTMINTMKAITPLFLCLAIGLLSSNILAASKRFSDPTPQEKELMQASMVGDVDLIKTLLKQNVSVNAHGRYGKSALMFAVEEGDDDVAELLIEMGADVNAVTQPGCTALTIAAEGGFNDLVALLLEKGAKIDEKNKVCYI